MIKSLTVTNHLGESLKLELGSPAKSGLLVRNIEGLDPVKADINVTELALIDGALYNSARQTSRNIVLTLGMIFAPTVEDSRHKVYKYFPVKKKVTLVIETDTRNASTQGYVESNTVGLFTSDESCQVSIICPDPYFYEKDGSSSAFSGAEPMFEFPFSNESLDEKLIEFASIRKDSRAIINYQGDADTGLMIHLHALGDVKNPVLYNTQTLESMKIDTDMIEKISGAPYQAADDIIISTVKGNKYVQLLRNGQYTNIIGALDKVSDWFQLTPGDNIFSYSADEGEKELIITFNYRSAYGGI